MLDPMTNVSNVYFGLSRADGRGAVAPGMIGSGPVWAGDGVWDGRFVRGARAEK